jgi:hypothetical protein
MQQNLFYQGFIYITGWIGWVGRKYIRAVSTTKILLKVKSLMFH